MIWHLWMMWKSWSSDRTHIIDLVRHMGCVSLYKNESRHHHRCRTSTKNFIRMSVWTCRVMVIWLAGQNKEFSYSTRHWLSELDSRRHMHDSDGKSSLMRRSGLYQKAVTELCFSYGEHMHRKKQTLSTSQSIRSSRQLIHRHFLHISDFLDVSIFPKQMRYSNNKEKKKLIGRAH